MRVGKLCAVFVLVLVLAGCDPILSLQAWFSEEDFVSEPALEGSWVTSDGKQVLTVEPGGNSGYVLTYTAEGKTSWYQARIVRRGRFYLMDLQAEDGAMEELFKEEYWLPIVFTHFLGRIELDGDRMTLSYFVNLKSAIKDGNVPLAHLTSDEMLILTAETGELRELALEYAEETDEQAFSTLGEFLRQPPEVGLVYRGRQYGEEGKYPSAADAFGQALEQRPDYADAHHGLGKALLAQGFYEKAEVSLERAVTLEPSNARFRRDLAFAYLALRRYGQARLECRVALQLEPEEAEAFHFLALADFLEKRFGEAIRHFEEYEVMEGSPELSVFLFHALALRNARRPQDARALLESHRRDFRQYGYLELLMYEAGAIDEEKLLLTSHGDFRLCQSHFYAGSLHYLQGETEAARRNFQQVLSTRLYAAPEYLVALARLREIGG